jgi:glycosyltransferase involved in cell wall biosynthesis
MRVAILTPEIGTGTFGTLAGALAAGLSASGLGVELLMARRLAPGEADDPPVPIRSFNRGHTSSSFVPLARYLRSERPDVLLSLSVVANFPALAASRIAKAPTKVVISEHANLSVDLRVEHRWSLKMNSIPFLIRALYGQCDGFVAVSNSVLRDPVLTRVFDPARKPHAVIPNPVRLDVEERAKDDSVAHPWVRDNHDTVVAVGRLVNQKDLDLLIHAVARLTERGRQLRLLILGEGPDRARLEDLVRTLGLQDRVALPGWYANPLPTVAGSQLFALPSRSEGSPLALLEAMALGRPIVAANNPGGASELIRDRTSGLLVRAGDAEALSNGIDELLGDPSLRQALGAEARIRSREFRPQTIGHRYAAFFSWLLEGNAAGLFTG